MRKPFFACAKTKAYISCVATTQLISAIVSASQVVQSPFLLKSEISSLQPSSAAVQSGLCRTSVVENRFSRAKAAHILSVGT